MKTKLDQINSNKFNFFRVIGKVEEEIGENKLQGK